MEKKPIIAHRGAHSFFCENTLPACAKAFELACYGVEIDLVCSADDKLLLAHDPFADKQFTLDENGKRIEDNRFDNFFELEYSDIRKLRLGEIAEKKFPGQTLCKTYFPLLTEFLLLAKRAKTLYKHDFLLCLEVKSDENQYGKFYPFPERYARLLVAELKEFSDLNIVIFSSDLLFLTELHRLKPALPLIPVADGFKDAAFFDNKMFSGFALHHKTWSKEAARILRKNEKTSFLWTVNSEEAFLALPDFRFTAAVSDFPLSYFMQPAKRISY
jgi:glycerophosphoryl diester phosphodiesterase